jgi:NADH:ubiquinone oxidoreductase subunit 6 (subunit J)
MFRNPAYVKLALLMLLLVAAAMFMGIEPWGPN